jgi:hypothetical protein
MPGVRGTVSDLHRKGGMQVDSGQHTGVPLPCRVRGAILASVYPNTEESPCAGWPVGVPRPPDP